MFQFHFLRIFNSVFIWHIYISILYTTLTIFNLYTVNITFYLTIVSYSELWRNFYCLLLEGDFSSLDQTFRLLFLCFAFLKCTDCCLKAVSWYFDFLQDFLLVKRNSTCWTAEYYWKILNFFFSRKLGIHFSSELVISFPSIFQKEIDNRFSGDYTT